MPFISHPYAEKRKHQICGSSTQLSTAACFRMAFSRGSCGNKAMTKFLLRLIIGIELQGYRILSSQVLMMAFLVSFRYKHWFTSYFQLIFFKGAGQGLNTTQFDTSLTKPHSEVHQSILLTNAPFSQLSTL